MATDLAARLARLAGNQTLELVHQGRRSGKPYRVTIWFLVEGDTVYLVTADTRRQWPRNVLERRDVTLKIGGETFTGTVEPINDAAGRAHVMGLVGRKYWYAMPMLWLSRALTEMGLTSDHSGAFRVRLDAGQQGQRASG